MTTRDDRIQRIQLAFIRAQGPVVEGLDMDDDAALLGMYGPNSRPLAEAMYSVCEDIVGEVLQERANHVA